MKHLKTFEGQQRIRNRRLLKNMKMSTDGKIPPGMYVIFKNREYDWKNNRYVNMLMLGKVIKYDHGVEEDSYYGETSKYESINIYVIDIESEWNDIIAKKGKDHIFNSPLGEVLFTSSSLKTTEEEFNRIKKTEPYCDWEMNRDLEKYNM